jgi:chromosome partitioning protein
MHITVAGCKGGVGRSTTAIHLACYLSYKGSVVLVDADPNRTTLIWSQRGPHLPFDALDADRSIDFAAYDHSVFDSPLRPTPETLQELAKPEHYLLLVTTPDTFALDALLPTLRTFEAAGATHYGVLLTRCPPAYPEIEARAREALQAFPVFHQVIQQHTAYEKSAQLGVPVYAVKTLDHNALVAWSDYEKVGDELMWRLWH